MRCVYASVYTHDMGATLNFTPNITQYESLPSLFAGRAVFTKNFTSFKRVFHVFFFTVYSNFSIF